MKKLIALLLVICMVMSLVACKKPAENPGGSTGQSAKATEGAHTKTPTETTGKPDAPTEGVGVPETPNTEKPVERKKLQVYGYASDYYKNLSYMKDGSYIWMVRAAIDEWATLNNIEVEFVGSYDQKLIAEDIESGGKPDLLLACDKFPIPQLSGITRAFTQEEYDALTEICGTHYLDMLKYKGQSYGVAAPWASGTLLYYNKTQFEKYGIKSPGDYFMAGNWNWDTYEKCITEITKDEDADGTNELYGSGYTSLLIPQFYYQKLNEDGTITSLIRDSDIYAQYLELLNRCRTAMVEGKQLNAYISSSPRPATSIGDALWYDFTQMHRVLDNGDVIEAVPIPKYTNDSESFYQHTPVYSAILSSCDEPEAALSLLKYILQAGMRYMSDFSLGLYECGYEGITGASEYSAAWKQRFETVVAERQDVFDKLTGWNQTLYAKTAAYIQEADIHYIDCKFPGLDGETEQAPPNSYVTSKINEIAAREEEWIKIFNETYGK